MTWESSEYYPNIDHEILIRTLRRKIRNKNAINALACAIATKTGDSKTGGVPQGLSISNILAALYLEDVDVMYKNKYINYFRYVDDILVLCSSEAAARLVYEDISRYLNKRKKLSCHEIKIGSKSSIGQLNDGVDYLGFNISFNSAEEKPYISVRKSSYKRIFQTIANVFTLYGRSQRQERDLDKLIWSINLKITGCVYRGRNFGWLFFFIMTDNITQLSRLDAFVVKFLESVRKVHA